jgi:hypothetical protein
MLPNNLMFLETRIKPRFSPDLGICSMEWLGRFPIFVCTGRICSYGTICGSRICHVLPPSVVMINACLAFG